MYISDSVPNYRGCIYGIVVEYTGIISYQIAQPCRVLKESTPTVDNQPSVGDSDVDSRLYE